MSLCNDQATFNKAFQKAVDKYPDLESQQLTSKDKGIAIALSILLFILTFIFIVWAIILAQRGKDRVMHTVLALVFSPFYIIGFYITKLWPRT